MRTTSSLLKSLGGAAFFLSTASVSGCATLTAADAGERERPVAHAGEEAPAAEGSVQGATKASEGSCGEGSCGEGSCG